MNSTDSMRQDLSHILCSFDPITLADMDAVKLLDRIDTKYVFNNSRLPHILEGLVPYYKILDVNGVKQNRYETLYFDTADYQLYLAHHNGRTNRYKVRYRKYVDSDLVFFEVKHKNNKGRTIKSRVKRDNIDEVVEGESSKLIKEKTPLYPRDLQSNLWVNYSRITLVKKTGTERLTLDIDLQFKKGEQNLAFENLVIAEVKQEKLAASPFIKMMRFNHVREGSISKYCFGVISLIASIKKNNFKPHLSTLIKLSHDTEISKRI